MLENKQRPTKSGAYVFFVFIHPYQSSNNKNDNSVCTLIHTGSKNVDVILVSINFHP